MKGLSRVAELEDLLGRLYPVMEARIPWAPEAQRVLDCTNVYPLINALNVELRRQRALAEKRRAARKRRA